MAISVRYNVRDADGQVQEFIVSLEALLDIAKGNRDATLGEVLRGIIPAGQTLVGGAQLEGRTSDDIADVSNASTIGQAISFQFTGTNTPPAPSDAIETSGQAGQRAAFGDFLTRGGLDPGNSFARQAGENRFGQRTAAFQLSQLLNPGRFSGANAFTNFLDTQRVGGARENLSNLFSQLRNLDRSTIGPRDGVEQVGGLAGALSGRDAVERSQLSNAANALLDSSFSPLINRTRRSDSALESDFLQAQNSGFGGDFGQFLDFRLGLDRLRG